MHLRSLLVIIVVIVAITTTACTPTELESTPTTIAPTTTTSLPTDTPPCLSGELPFIEEGVVAALDSQGRDAQAIAGIRWHALNGCERIEIEFLSVTGSPASRIGPVGVSMLADTGIVRVTLSDAIIDSAVADTTLNGVLLDGWFVVEGIADGLAVDLHLASRAAARAFTTTSPARLIIDLVPAQEDLPIAAPASDGGIVLMSPQAGVGLYPLQITGYSAPGIDAVRIILSDSTGVFIDRSVSTLSPFHVWHAFDVGLADGPSDSVDLFVGTVTEDEDPASGVEVPLDLP
ncbi:MAG: hypothetical protein U9N78_04485 [Actinomycetota bacterium]|nr:hypothetical protein [Actinomycetota bacterium]